MKGFLFIGDPHVHHMRPGRRIDDYTTSVLEKLRIAGEVARERGLMPVILGDLLHVPGQNHLRTLCRLIKVLKGFPVKPIVLDGNHDKAESLLRDEDALYLLALTDIVEVYDGQTREAAVFDFEGHSVALWVCPYGAKIPEKIESTAEQVVLITHADLAFAGAYPGSAPLHEIAGCDFVVNGHMHKESPSVQVGKTWWHNPGNIEPLSIDCIDHVPAVWAWQVGQSAAALEKLPLPHVRDCFNMVGHVIAKASDKESVEAIAPIIPAATSQFAELLSAQTPLEAPRADDNSSFVQEVRCGLQQLKARAPVSSILLALAQKQHVPVVVEVENPITPDPVPEEVAS